MNPEDVVLSNIQDSVSRIVDNLQFTHIEEAAHSRLVGLAMDKFKGMSDTCRALLENSGRTGTGLNVGVDLKHLFRMHHVDFHALVEYTQQVRAFPPKAFEIHGDESSESARRARVARQEKENSKKLKLTSSKKSNPATVVMRHPTPPVYSLPLYDDMSPSDLGFHDDSSSDEDTPQTTPLSLQAPPPPTYLSPPPPPPPLPPLSHFSESLTTSPEETIYNIPSFDPQVPPPSYSNPEPVVKLKLFKADPPLQKPVEKWPRFEKYRAPPSKQRLPEKRKVENLAPPPKMTKKRLMQTNYERRLRNEQMAMEERKKEKQLEMKQKQKEKWEKMLKSQVETPRKFKERLQAKKTRVEVSKDEKPQHSKQHIPIMKDENENYKIATPKKFQKFTSSESLNQVTSSERVARKEEILGRAPLPKLRVVFKNAPNGRLIKRVETTEFHNVKGTWMHRVNTWQNKQGVFSRTVLPNGMRRGRCGSVTILDSPKISNFSPKFPKIPKLKLRRNSDNSYSRVL